MNTMREIKIGKVTLNIGAGKDKSKLDNAMILLKIFQKLNQSKQLLIKESRSGD